MHFCFEAIPFSLSSQESTGSFILEADFAHSTTKAFMEGLYDIHLQSSDLSMTQVWPSAALISLESDSGCKSVFQLKKYQEWQLQDELRNIELEKELENRIQRRREESGERDRWRDDDRDGEGKREEKYIEDHHRDDKYQDDKQREQRLSRERAFDKHESKHSREGSRAPEGRYRESKHYDSDRDYSFHYEDRYTHHRDHRDNSRLSRNREGSRETKTRGNKESATEGDCKGTSMGHQDENLGRERLSVLPCFDAGDVVVNDKQQKRVRGMGSNVGREEHR
eukprot:Gb_19157 [translate_table: standard]